MSRLEAEQPSLVGSYLPQRIQRRGQHLLSQQCWLWGQDVKRAEGNLLMAFGFERLRPPDETVGSTQYTLSLANGLHIRLWGFGMYFGAEVGIYVNRYKFIPHSAEFTEGWQGADAMRTLPRSRELLLLAQAADWIASYESWVLREIGLPYRQRALREWEERVCKADDIAVCWQQLSEDIRSQSQKIPRRVQLGLDHQPRTKKFPTIKRSWLGLKGLHENLGFAPNLPSAKPKGWPQSLRKKRR